MRHHDQQRGHAEIGTLTAHVRAGHEQDGWASATVKKQGVGNKSSSTGFLHSPLDNGVARANEFKSETLVNHGLGPAAQGRQMREACKQIELRDASGGGSHARSAGQELGPHFGKDAALDLE